MRGFEKRSLYSNRILIYLQVAESFFIPYLVIVPAEISWLWTFVLLITFVFISEMAIIDVNKKVRAQAYKLYPEAFA